MPTGKIHEVRLHPEEFKHILSGNATFLLREDEGFHANDTLDIIEWGELGYMGRRLTAEVTYLFCGRPLERNHVAMSIKVTNFRSRP